MLASGSACRKTLTKTNFIYHLLYSIRRYTVHTLYSFLSILIFLVTKPIYGKKSSKSFGKALTRSYYLIHETHLTSEATKE